MSNFIDNYDINVGAIYYPVADLYNPPVVYPSSDSYSYYGSGSTDESTDAPTGSPSMKPSVHVRRMLEARDLQSESVKCKFSLCKCYIISYIGYGDDYIPPSKYQYSIDNGNIFHYAYEMAVALTKNNKTGDLTTIDNRYNAFSYLLIYLNIFQLL